MSEPAQDRRSRRGGGRDARRQLRANSAATITPFITRQLEPLDILTNESAEIIENNTRVRKLTNLTYSSLTVLFVRVFEQCKSDQSIQLCRFPDRKVNHSPDRR